MRAEFSRRAARSGENQFIVKRWRHIAFMGLVALLLGVAAWFALRPREPVYQGKKLSEWLEQASQNGCGPEREEALVAINRIGTNAIAALLRDLQAEESLIQTTIESFDGRLPFEIRIISAGDRRKRAMTGFQVLGPIAEPAIPKLQELMLRSEMAIADSAPDAICSIGTEKAATILIQGLTNEVWRYWTARSLGSLRSQARSAVTALLTNLESADAIMRAYAAEALGQITLEPGLVVPALITRISDSNRSVRVASVSALAQFGSVATGALAELHQLTEHKDNDLRKVATWANHLVRCDIRDGGIIRGPKERKVIALVFTGHEHAEGGETIVDQLARRQAKASFFLTGDFLENPSYQHLIRRIIKDSHLLGPHSDKHLLYCSWDAVRKTLVSREQFRCDVWVNQGKLSRLITSVEGPLSREEEIQRIKSWRREIQYFLPAYEHYNRQMADWTSDMYMTLINFTPGTRSNADYTGEADTNFVSSQAIFDSIVQREREDPHGLNGFILLFHLGSGPGRKDKFHHRFGELLDYLAGKGYEFVRVDELLELKETE